MLIIAYWALTASSLGWCAIGGERAERAAAGVVLVAFIATQLVTPIDLAGWRIGVAVVDATAFAALFLLTVKFDRWWLVAASGAQMVTVLTHAMALAAPALLLRTNVEIRWMLGLVLLSLLALGPLEASRLRRLAERV